MLVIFLNVNCLVYYHCTIGRGKTRKAVVPGSSSTTHNKSNSLFGGLGLSYLNYISFLMIFFSLEELYKGKTEALQYTNTKCWIKHVKQVDTYC